MKGVTSDAIGGALSGGFKGLVLDGKWDGGEFWSQAGGAGASKLVGNGFDWAADEIGDQGKLASKANKAIHKKHFTTFADYVKYRKDVASWALLAGKEVGSIWAGQESVDWIRKRLKLIGAGEKFKRDSNYTNIGSGAIKDALKLW